MPAPWPALDVAGFTSRTAMPAGDVGVVVSSAPGFLQSKIAAATSYVYARLRKLYGLTLPWGNAAPPIQASGTSPPAVSLFGVPQLGSAQIAIAIVLAGALGAALFVVSADNGATWSMASASVPGGVAGSPAVAFSGKLAGALQADGSYLPPNPSAIVVQIATGGTVGTAAFEWSADGGITWTTGVVTAARVALGTTGLTALFPSGTYVVGGTFTGQGVPTASSIGIGYGLTALFTAGTYSTDNLYAAPVPVPEVILNWITAIVTPEAYRKRGVDAADAQFVSFEKDRDRAIAELAEAADGNLGKFDLPVNDGANGQDAGSNHSTGSPLTYSETSPYAWTDAQVCAARGEDRAGYGTSGGGG